MLIEPGAVLICMRVVVIEKTLEDLDCMRMFVIMRVVVAMRFRPRMGMGV